MLTKEKEQRSYETVSTPAYVVWEEKIEENARILGDLARRSGCRILLAQKAFSMYRLYPLLSRYIQGTTASGLYEARLGYEEMGKENHIFSPAYKEQDMEEIIRLCDHIIFNSPSQLMRFKEQVRAGKKSVGLRINPQFSTQSGHDIYDPCAPLSRLGTPAKQLTDELLDGVDGLHFHTLCEQNADDLVRTLEQVDKVFGRYLPRMKWINFGGGHHITREDYDMDALEGCIRLMQDKYGLAVYLEPGEAVALQAGELVTTVVDIVENGGQIAILDTSAACHMPDVIEMPYRPPLLGAGDPSDEKEREQKPYVYRLAGPTCLAGDVIGDYCFARPLRPGDRLHFLDMAIYTMVKNNTFNGMPLPDIVLHKKSGDMELVRRFGYDEFKRRL